MDDAFFRVGKAYGNDNACLKSHIDFAIDRFFRSTLIEEKYKSKALNALN